MLLEFSYPFLLKINALIHNLTWVFPDFQGFVVGPCWVGRKKRFYSGGKAVIRFLVGVVGCKVSL